MIRFNVPHITGKEKEYFNDVLTIGRLAGDGKYTAMCRSFFVKKFGFLNNYLTTSGTDALEMAALLIDIMPGDEVIMPSFTFVSTANAFILRGAKIVFADCLSYHPNIDHCKIESLVTKKTKAIVVVHYAGVSCEMKTIVLIAKKYNLFVVEDAAQAINAYYNNEVLGNIGDFGALSFHETKNIVCGEGGLLVVKDHATAERAEIVREKGTNRSSFFRGETDKYGWVDLGSSYLASDILASFLYAQLEMIDHIHDKRKKIWIRYNESLNFLKQYGFELPEIPLYAVHNYHIFYLLCPNLKARTELIDFLNRRNIKAVFHYLPLHHSPYYQKLNLGKHIVLPNSERFSDTLLRLPVYPDLTEENQDFIIQSIMDFQKKQ